MIRGVGLWTPRSQVRFPSVPLSGSNLVKLLWAVMPDG